MYSSRGIVIKGIHTDIGIQIYSNRIFLIVSQFKKFGSMITVSRESAFNNFNSDIYSVKTLFGRDDEIIHVAARYIAEQINIDQQLLLCICLKDYDIETLKTIITIINSLKPS